MNGTEAEKKLQNKKRLMFIAGEDFYLFTYCIIVILKELQCDKKEKLFEDHRKLAFIINIIINDSAASIYSRYKNGEDLNIEDRKVLVDCYYNSIGKDRILYRLLTVLEKRELLELQRDPESNILNMYLRNSSVTDEIFSSEIFQKEIRNVRVVTDFYKKVGNVKFETLLKNLFYNYKVGNWLI